MNASDRESIRSSGAIARQSGVAFDENPFYHSPHPFEEWVEICMAWSAGWLIEDAGRDEAMRVRMRVQFW